MFINLQDCGLDHVLKEMRRQSLISSDLKTKIKTTNRGWHDMSHCNMFIYNLRVIDLEVKKSNFIWSGGPTRIFVS